ncbi:MAG: ABC transporter permease [Bacteroidetes bacterium]|nr:MAG: ABC transporter permease [Bacteroidota bacterium]
MLAYFLRRLGLFVPTLFIIALVAFGLSKLTEDDPVLRFENDDRRSGVYSKKALLRLENEYRTVRAKLRLDKPPFYFAIRTLAAPDTIYRFLLNEERETLRNLVAKYGNWPAIEAWFNQIKPLEYAILDLPSDAVSGGRLDQLKRLIRDFYGTYDSTIIESRLEKMDTLIAADSFLTARLGASFRQFSDSWRRIPATATPWKNYLPAFSWYGADNQFHHWFFGVLRGDFGYSYTTRQAAADRIIPALKWTLLLNLLAIALAYLVAVPLGVWAARRKGGLADQWITAGSFMLYSLPAFWTGTLLLTFFTTRAYGMEIFQGVWAGHMNFDRFGEDFWRMAGHLVLPVFCIAYPGFAFLIRQMRGSMVEVLRQDYIRTARAKGLPEKQVIWRHAFRNALFPLITTFANVFPAAIVGSVAVEYIFNIPGMGKLMLDVCLQHDWPVVFAILFLGAILTLAGMLVADILYAIFDPRVSFRRR